MQIAVPRNFSTLLLACKRSADARAMILRLQETSGQPTTANLSLTGMARASRLSFSPFEIKTIRVQPDKKLREVTIVEEL
jgi:predicted N-formylglutamate amidohydrolase